MFILLLDLIIERCIIEFRVLKVRFESYRTRLILFIEVIKASEHDYLSTITELQINSQYAGAFMSGRIQLHMV